MRLSFQLIIFLFVSCVAFSGCQHIPLLKDYMRVKDAQAQISKLEDQHRADLAASNQAIENKMQGVIDSKDGQLQAGADSLYIADQGFKYYNKPARLDLIIHNSVEETIGALGKAPTFEAIKTQNARLEVLLDEAKTSLVQLQADHVVQMEANAKLVDTTNKAQADLAAAKDAKLQTETKFIADNKKLSDALATANNSVQTDLTNKANNAAATERLKAKLMTICGIAALACLAGAFYSPVGKEFLVVAGAALGGATVAIPFIEPWMIAMALSVIAALVTAVFLVKHNTVTKVNSNLINAIQDTKETASPEVASTLMQNVQSWNTNYVKDAAGNLVTVADKSVESFIQKALIASGRLPAPIVSTSTPVPTPTIVSTTPTPKVSPTVTPSPS